MEAKLIVFLARLARGARGERVTDDELRWLVSECVSMDSTIASLTTQNEDLRRDITIRENEIEFLKQLLAESEEMDGDS